MTLNEGIISDMAEADHIKSQAPQSGVTADAIFLAIRGTPLKFKKFRNNPSGWPGLPSERFHEAMKNLEGRTLTIGEFMLLAGMMPATKVQKNAVGAWLRGMGRKHRKSGGRQVFDI